MNHLALTIQNDNTGDQCGTTYKERCDLAKHWNPRKKSMEFYRMAIKCDDWHQAHDYEPATHLEILQGAFEIAEYYEQHVNEGKAM